jgi:hypothetical protein
VISKTSISFTWSFHEPVKNGFPPVWCRWCNRCQGKRNSRNLRCSYRKHKCRKRMDRNPKHNGSLCPTLRPSMQNFAGTLCGFFRVEGNIFGGFTPLEWDSTTYEKANPSLKSFLFTLWRYVKSAVVSSSKSFTMNGFCSSVPVHAQKVSQDPPSPANGYR